MVTQYNDVPKALAECQRAYKAWETAIMSDVSQPLEVAKLEMELDLARIYLTIAKEASVYIGY